VFVSRSKLHQYLSVSVRRDRAASGLCRMPLELRYPISNKFVEEVSFAEEAGLEIGRPVEIVLDASQAEASTRGAVRAPLRDGRGGVLGFCLIAEPTLENILERTNAGFTPFMALFAGLAVLAGLWVSHGAVRRRVPAWIEALLVVLLIWGARAMMLLLDFQKHCWRRNSSTLPATVPPSCWASRAPRGHAFEHARAPWDAGAIYGAVSRMTSSAPERPGAGARRFGKILATVFSVLVCLVLTRAYGAAVRSFVFDSSIRYDEPSTLVPDPVALVMLGSLLALTLSLMLAYGAMLRLFGQVIASARRSWVGRPFLG